MILRGLESCANGMLALMDMNDNTANNLANVNTVGFKKGSIKFQDLMDSAVYTQSESVLRNDSTRYLGDLSVGSSAFEYTHDFSQGALNQTDNPYDLAIEGDGFFKIQDVDGKIYYTRNGSFTRNDQDYLVTKQGEYVLDINNRRIRMIPEDLDPDLVRDKVQIIIGEKGNIEMNAGLQKVPMQTIGVWDFANKDDLFEISDTRFIPKTPEENPELRSEKFVMQQGMLELSNCNVIKEMINTISTQRNYESLAKIVTTNGEMLDTAVTLGRLRV
jgi:flagellar basal body rod protein FlgG